MIMFNRRRFGIRVLLCAGCAAGAYHQPLSAQAVPAAQAADAGQKDRTEGLQDIIVTAQKRAESAMSAPLSISALNADLLASKRVDDLAGLSRISPGLVTGEQSGKNRVFIRGIGLTATSNGVDPSTTFSVDGVIVARPAAQLGSFFDVDRVEVLRGPQGTLYGRNATGGAINVITRRPEADFGGYLRASYGNYDAIETNGALTGALDSDGKILARISFRTRNHQGYGKNIASGADIGSQNARTGRLSLWFKPSSRFDYLVTAEYGTENDTNYATTGFGPFPGKALDPGLTTTVPRNIASDIEPRNRRKAFALSGVGRLDLSNSITLNSTTGYRYFYHLNQVDSDITTSPASDLYYTEKSRQFSQELSLSYKNKWLTGIVGAYYFHEDLRGLLDAPTAGVSFNGLAPNITNAKAAFTQWTVEPIDNLRLTAGVRYSDEKRTRNGTFSARFGLIQVPLAARATFHATTPKFGIDYTISRNTLLYASYTKGFKSGGFVVGNTNPLFRPEKVDAYEAGIKSSLFDRHLQLTLAGFVNSFKDLQVQKIIVVPPSTVATSLLINAARARIKGIEFTAIALPAPGLTLSFNSSYLDAKFKSFQSVNSLTGANQTLDGNRLPGAPKWTVDVGFEYKTPLSNGGAVTVGANYSWKSLIYFDEFNRQATSQAAAGRADANIRYDLPGNKLTVTTFVKNITNKDIISYKILGNSSGQFFPVYGSYEAPRTYGVEVGVKF